MPQLTWLKFSVTQPLLHQTPSYFLEEESRPSWRPQNFSLVELPLSLNRRGEGEFRCLDSTKQFVDKNRYNVCPLIQFGPTYNFLRRKRQIPNSKLQPTRCNVSWLIDFYRRSTCFRRFLRPSSGAHNSTYSFRYCQPILLLAATVEEIELTSS